MNAPKQAPDLLEYAKTLTELKRVGREHKGPCPFCGGRDRFAVFADGTGWMCRGCQPESGGVFDLIARARRMQIADVMREYRSPSSYDRRERQVPQARQVEGEFTDPGWQSSAFSEVGHAFRAIRGHQPAMDYIAGRGLADAIDPFRLGYSAKRNSICIPWVGRNKQIVAVKFRCLNPQDPKRRFTQMRGGRQIVFGAHLAVRRPTVIITEGEFNAMSLWLALGDVADVVSFGGDANTSPVNAVIGMYPSAVVWMDDVEKLNAAMANNMPHMRVAPMRSPSGMDANDVLVQHGRGTLRELVQMRLNDVVQSVK